MKPDGSGRQKLSDAITFLVSLSPDEQWAVVWSVSETRLVRIADRRSLVLCTTCNIGPILQDSPGASWSGDGTTMVVNLGEARGPTGGTLLVPWRGMEAILARGSLSAADPLKLPGARRLLESSITPGQTADRYASTRQAEQSNLYRIPLP